MATEASPRPSDAPSKLGVYAVERRLGRGGMATVYLGKAPDGRTVAIKVMLPQLAFEPTFLERFLREIEAARRLEHKNVVQVLGAGEHDGLPYMVCEYVEGGSLETLLEEAPKLAAPLALEIAAQLLEGLSAAHGQGIVHRDLKPANLLLTTSGVLKIADFGVAKVAGASSLTRTGALFGTPAYMSPEQTQGLHVDHRSDLFSAGVIVYELLTGINPHKTEDPSAALLRVQLGVPPIAEVDASLSPAAEAVVEKLLEREPEARFQSADEALAALLPLVEDLRKAQPKLLAEGVLDPMGVSRKLRSAQAAEFVRKAEALAAAGSLQPAALWAHRARLLDENAEPAQKLWAGLSKQTTLNVGAPGNPKIHELEAAVAKAPDNTKALLQLAQLHRMDGNLPRAVACFKRLLRLRPSDAYVASQLTQLTGEAFAVRQSAAATPSEPRRVRPLPATLAPPTVARTAGDITEPGGLSGSDAPTIPPSPDSGPMPPPAADPARVPTLPPQVQVVRAAPTPAIVQPVRAPAPVEPIRPVKLAAGEPPPPHQSWANNRRKVAIIAVALVVLGWAASRVGLMIRRNAEEAERAAQQRTGFDAPRPSEEQRALEARLTAGMLAADRQIEIARGKLGKGEYLAAAEAAEIVLERYPKLPQATDAAFLRGKALLLAGKASEALDALSRFTSVHRGSKHHGEALLRSGEALLAIGDAASALLPLDELLRTQPDDPWALEARLVRGRALAAKGDRLSAEAELRHVLGRTAPTDVLHGRAQAAIAGLDGQAPDARPAVSR